MYGLTYVQKRVIKLAPDAVIRINGITDITICPICNAKLKISDYVTTLNTSLSNNTTVGTASLTIAMPRHGHYGNYMVRGGIVFGIKLMDEVEIFLKSRFPNSNGEHLYFKSFWGVISSITDSYSEGVQIVHINCQSILRWLQLMSTNEHPSMLTLNDTSAKTDLAAQIVAGKIYAGLNPYQMIYMLVNLSLLNIVVPSIFISGNSEKKQTNSTVMGTFGSAENNLLFTWKDKFKNISSALRMFGITSESLANLTTVDPNKQRETRLTTNPKLSGSTKPISPIELYWDSSAMMDFRPFFRPEDSKQLEIINNVYKNNLEIASEVKLYTGFEFYLDTNGEIIFKPPFWNLDTRANPICTIDDSDILNWEFSESESEMVTRIDVTGSPIQWSVLDGVLSVRGIFTDWKLAGDIGLRVQQISGRFFTTANMCYYHAISELDRINANRFKGTLTIIGRPEMRLGFPLYIKSRDCFIYPDNIAHNFTFGGPFTTTISFSGMRTKYIGKNRTWIEGANPDKEGVKLEKTGDNSISNGFVGLSRVLVYDADIQDPNSVISSPALNLTAPTSTSIPSFYKFTEDTYNLINYSQPSPKEALASLQAKTLPDNPQLSGALQNNINRDKTYPIKMNRVGSYKEIPWTQAADVLKQFKDAKASGNSDLYLNLMETFLVVSDEYGYTLIGNYENGRSLFLDKDFTLKKRTGNIDETIFGVQKNVGFISIENPIKATNMCVPKTLNNFITFSAYSLAELTPKYQRTSKSSYCTCQDPIGKDNSQEVTTNKPNKLMSNVGTK